MTALHYAVEVSRREMARQVWPAAVAVLRAHGALYSPRAWAYVFCAWLRLRFGVATTVAGSPPKPLVVVDTDP